MVRSPARRDLPPLNWLRTFEAAARREGFAAAAAELNVTPAAVSQQVKLLEQRLGVALFRRYPRRLALTDAGRAYLPAVQDGLDRLAAGTGELLGDVRQGPLSVRVPASFGVLWLAPRLARFHAAWPAVDLRLFTSPRPVEFGDDGTDLEIRYGRGDWPGVRGLALTRETIAPVCSPRLLRRPGRERRAVDLARLTLLHVIGYRDGWKSWCHAAGAHALDTDRGAQFDTSAAALAAAAAGGGVALGRWPMVADAIRAGTLVAPFAPALATDEGYHLVWSDRPAAGGKIAAFRDWLAAEAAADRDPPPAWPGPRA